MKKNKSTLMYVASVLFYAAAILEFVSGNGNSMGIVYMALGSLWLCTASAAKLKENKDKDEGKIKTERLIIHTASHGEMERFIELQTDEMLKAAYSEMLDESLKHPEQRQWYALWMTELPDGTHVGELCFKGLNDDGSVEIGYGISEEYRGHGYATEAVSAVTRWALIQPDVTRVEAEAEADNIASVKVLTKCGFTPTGTFGEEGPRFGLTAETVQAQSF